MFVTRSFRRAHFEQSDTCGATVVCRGAAFEIERCNSTQNIAQNRTHNLTAPGHSGSPVPYKIAVFVCPRFKRFARSAVLMTAGVSANASGLRSGPCAIREAG